MKRIVLAAVVSLSLAAAVQAGVSIDGIYGTDLGPGDGQPETRWWAEVPQGADPMTAGEVYYVYWWRYQARKDDGELLNGGASFLIDADDTDGYQASAESVIQPLFPWTGEFEVKDWTFGDPEGSKNAINEAELSLEGATDYDFRWIVGYQATYPSAVNAPGDPSDFNYPQYKESSSDTWINIDSNDPGRPNPWLFTSGSDQNYFLSITEHTEAPPDNSEFSLAVVEISHEDKTSGPIFGCGGPGDADADGDVDDDDLSLLLANWGADVDCTKGEFNETPPVDDDDLSLLLANWTGASSAAVPEPATVVLLVAAPALLKLRRKA